MRNNQSSFLENDSKKKTEILQLRSVFSQKEFHIKRIDESPDFILSRDDKYGSFGVEVTALHENPVYAEIRRVGSGYADSFSRSGVYRREMDKEFLERKPLDQSYEILPFTQLWKQYESGRTHNLLIRKVSYDDHCRILLDAIKTKEQKYTKYNTEGMHGIELVVVDYIDWNFPSEERNGTNFYFWNTLFTDEMISVLLSSQFDEIHLSAVKQRVHRPLQLSFISGESHPFDNFVKSNLKYRNMSKKVRALLFVQWMYSKYGLLMKVKKKDSRYLVLYKKYAIEIARTNNESIVYIASLMHGVDVTTQLEQSIVDDFMIDYSDWRSKYSDLKTIHMDHGWGSPHFSKS